MVSFTLITSNNHELAEFRRLIPDFIEFDHQALELDEVQTLDLDQIVRHKALQAYNLIGKPVVVVDVAAGIDKLKIYQAPSLSILLMN
jgi:inosine/xanthosine triphosphate pyrophosphatase family protein